MFDISLRSKKDQLFNPIAKLTPSFITPFTATAVAFVCGFGCCWAVAINYRWVAVSMWLLNRFFDCLDGSLARQRQQQSDLGGFLDLLSDFIIYSAIPISCALTASDDTQAIWLPVALAEASFHINNFVLFYSASILEKRKNDPTVKKAAIKELTSVSMRPALIEGLESGLMFTFMLANPEWTPRLCWILTVGVLIGTSQRVAWLIPVI